MSTGAAGARGALYGGCGRDDSFVARFTPPRSGTFMYHAHTDELREELAGLAGVLVVRDSSGVSVDDHAFLLKGEGVDGGRPLEINGRSNPDTVVLHVGHVARLRLLNLATRANAAASAFWLTARADSADQIANDSMVVRWVPAAKDGFDLPTTARAPRRAQEIVSIGETFDFEYTPRRPGTLRLEVRASGGLHRLALRVPIRIE